MPDAIAYARELEDMLLWLRLNIPPMTENYRFEHEQRLDAMLAHVQALRAELKREEEAKRDAFDEMREATEKRDL